MQRSMSIYINIYCSLLFLIWFLFARTIVVHSLFKIDRDNIDLIGDILRILPNNWSIAGFLKKTINFCSIFIPYCAIYTDEMKYCFLACSTKLLQSFFMSRYNSWLIFGFYVRLKQLDFNKFKCVFFKTQQKYLSF